MFESIQGCEELKGYLRTAVKKGAVGQSLLFTGNDIDLMGQFALELASGILSHQGSYHPDLHVYHPEGKLGMHTIESMRKLSEEVYLSPFEGHRKVFVLFQAERMLPTSSNALLKTFEEPAEDTLIILISAQPELILPTIKSRCRIIRFSGESSHATITEIPELADEIYHILKTARFGTYKELTAHTEKIGSMFDGFKKERAKTLRDQMLSEFLGKASITQTDAIDKESEGLAAMESANIVKKLFEIIVYWYRDLEILKTLALEKLIQNTQYINELKHQRFVELNEVVGYLKDAQLAYQRSTSLSLCLENLFLKLGKV
jgi:DNA polymerase-3 subunit delta'